MLERGEAIARENEYSLIEQFLIFLPASPGLHILSVDTAYEMDPETSKLTALISAWWEKWEDKPVKVAQIISEATDKSSWEDGQDYINPELQAACDEIAGQGRNINRRMLGRWIEKNQDRRVDGKRIVAGGKNGGVRQWNIKK